MFLKKLPKFLSRNSLLVLVSLHCLSFQSADAELVVETFDFSSPDSDNVTALLARGWDFSEDQGTGAITDLVGLAPSPKGLILGGNTVGQPRISYQFGDWTEGAIEFFAFTRSSYSLARVAIENASGEQLFALLLENPFKVGVEAGSGGMAAMTLPNSGTNDLLNNGLGYTKFSVTWNGDAATWKWEHYLIDGTLNHSETGNATFATAGSPASLVLKTNKHDHEQRQFGICSLQLANAEGGLDPSDPNDPKAPGERDLIITTAIGQGADTFVQAGKTLDRGARTYLASQRYSQVGDTDKALRQAYLRFDLGDVSDITLIERAALEMSISHVGLPSLRPQFTIYGLNDDAAGQDWDEMNLPFEDDGPIPPGSSLDYDNDNNINASVTTVLGTVEWGGDVGDEVTFHSAELVGFLKADTDGLVTLIFQWTEGVVYDGTGDDRLQFATKENQESGQHAPRIVLDFGDPVDPGGPTEEELATLEALKATLFSNYIDSGSETLVNGYLSKLNLNGSFSDIQYSNSSTYELHVSRLKEMSNVFLSETTALGGDAGLLESISNSLDWWLTTDYIDSNWWWTYIGFPNRLAPLLPTLGPELESNHPAVYAKLVAYFDRVYDHLLVNPHGGGANLADMSYYALIGAIMESDVEKINTLLQSGFSPVLNVIPKSSSADGLRIDGTIFSHGPQLYNGTYGHELLNSSLKSIALLRGTIWDLGDEAIPFIEKVLIDGAARMSYGNWFDYNAMGRAIARPGSHDQASTFLNDVELVLTLEPDNQFLLENLRDEIKFDGSQDNTVLEGVTSFWYSDFLTYRKPDYYTSVRMVSTRTMYNEKGNGEGLKNRYFGDGVNFVLVNGNEYDKIQPVWNYEQLPGITAEQNGTTSPSVNWGEIGVSTFAGSVNDGDAAVAAMRLSHDGINGWKSWFVFGDVIVALGSDINGANSSSPVYTTLNQKISGTGEAATYSLLGTESTVSLGQSATLNSASWVWQENIGYVIPGGNSVAKLDITTQSGAWSEIGTGGSSTVSEDVFTLVLDHGVKPFDETYEYMLLPGASLEETRAFAQNPTVEVLSNTESIQAVHDHQSGKYGVAFLASGRSVTLPNDLVIQSYGRIVAIVEESFGVYKLTVADPNHSLSAVTLVINRQLEGEGAAPSGTNKTQLSIALPQGDYKGAPVTVILTDPSVEEASWARYFGDLEFSDVDKWFMSSRFGFYNAIQWPWIWSHEFDRFFYIAEQYTADGDMYWYSPQDDSWLYTEAFIFPWIYHYSSGSWELIGGA
jgi:chondroitin AC lyase